MLKATVRKEILWSALILGSVWLWPLAGCNTAEGAGEDIEDLGEGMEDVANDED